MLVLAIPTVALSGMFAMILGYAIPDFPGARWVSPVLGTVMYLWGGLPFLDRGDQRNTFSRTGNDALIGLAITVAFVASWGASLGVLPHDLDFWWELALLVVIMLSVTGSRRVMAQRHLGARLAGRSAARRGRADRR